MKFPSVITESFYPVQKLGSSSEDAQINGFTPSTAIFKTFLTGVLPLFLIFISLVVWGLLYLIPNKWFKDFSRNIAITAIVIIYLLHPTLTKVGLQLFQCIKVDEGVYKVKLDLNIDCYSYVHIKWCIIIGLPMIIIWVIACPFLVFWILFKNRKALEEVRIQKYLLILYQGLKDKCFYWELVNTIRKICMVCINVFMSTLDIIYSGSFAVLILIGFIRLQKRLNPYKSKQNNEIEMDAMITGTTTLFCGMMFVSDSNNIAGVIVLLMIVIFVLNLKFLIHWSFYMVFIFAGKYKFCYTLFMVFGMILCKRALAEKMLEEEGITYSIPKAEEVEEKTVNIQENIQNKTLLKKKISRRKINFNKKKTAVKDQTEEQISTTKRHDIMTISNLNKELYPKESSKDCVIDSCDPNQNNVTIAFGFKNSFFDIVEESSSDLNYLQRKQKSKASQKRTTKRIKRTIVERSSKKINPVNDFQVDETYDNYIPNSKNQMIFIDNMRSSVKEII